MKCPLCDMRCPGIERMCKHLMKAHRGEGFYQGMFGYCMCGMAISENRIGAHQDLAAHMEMHGGPRQHILDVLLNGKHVDSV